MKMKTIQRAFAWALTLVMVLSAAPLGVFAEGEEEQVCCCTVKCGETGKEDCPVCGGESGNPAACACKTQEELEAAAKLAAEEAERKAAEEAAQKAAEEEKRKAEEEAAKKAAEEEKRKAEEAAQKAAKEGGNPPAKAESKKSEDTTGKNIAPASDDDETELNNTVETVEVSFDTNGAEETIDPMMVAKGGTITLPKPARTGFTFDGWYVSKTFEGAPVDGSKTYNESTSLYAKWTENTATGVTVTFKFQLDGVADEQRTAKADGTLADPLPTYSKPGYNFLYWYLKTEDSKEQKVTSGTTFTQDTTVYAKWQKQPQAVTVTFDANGGKCGVERATVNENKKLGSLPTPTWAGHEFQGWYIKDTNEQVSLTTTYDQDTTLCAKWTLITYTVKFHDNYSTTNETYTRTFVYNSSDQLGKLDRDYYDFVGWAETPDGIAMHEQTHTVEDLPFGQETTLDLYAVWRYVPRKVTFDACGGTITKDGEEVTSVKAYTQESPINTVKAEDVLTPTKEGYTFLGWYIKDTGEKAKTTYDQDTTLEARWVSLAETKDVTPGKDFLNGIALKPGTDKVEIRVVQEDGPALNKIRSELGNVLDGNKLLTVYDLSVHMMKGNVSQDTLKSVNGLIRFDFTVTGNVVDVYHKGSRMSKDGKPGYSQTGNTLTIWTDSFSPYAIVTGGYQIKLDPQGGAFEEGVSNTMTTDTDGKLTEDLPVPTKTGYTFGGWYKVSTCTGEEVKKNDTVFDHNATIFAKWTPITYTVVFHDNYRTQEQTCTQGFDYGKKKQLSYDTTVIVRDYYRLNGWAETRDGAKVYEPQDYAQNLCSQQGAEKHLYAVWTYAPRQVTFDADGGKIKKGDAQVDAVVVDTQEKPINTVSAKDVPVPELREGYYFGGWYTRKDGKGDLVKTGEAKEPTVFTADATVYAYWIKFEPVTVTFKCQGGTARIGSTDVKEFTMQTKWPGVLDGTPTTPSRSSYKFEGWYTAAGVKVDEDTLFLRDSTVYARWKRAVSITGNPRTGDQVKLEAAIGILIAAAIGLGATVVLKKRKEK